MSKETFVLKVPADGRGVRIDAWLSEYFSNMSRSRIQALIKSGHVLLGRQAVNAHHKLAEGMEIYVEIPAPEQVSLPAENIPLEIIFEDGDIIVVNKAPDMVVHPAAGHSSGTLVNALLFHCSDLKGIGGELRPGIVHRLDKDTSGAIIVAKNDMAMENLVNQFKQRIVVKKYIAVVHGVPKKANGVIETMVGRSSHDRKKMTAKPSTGRHAVTHYEVIERYDQSSLLSLRIETGRTHQIRVHMAHIGHPVAGDAQYGSSSMDSRLTCRAPRHMLHARMLECRHPSTGNKLEFEAPIWPDMLDFIACLRQENAG